MPSRMMRDDIITSERWWQVSSDARTLWLSITLSADDMGRCLGTNFVCRTKYMAGTFDSARVEKLVAELHDVDLIRIYEVDGTRYFFVPRFRQRLRYSHSRYPEPPKEINDILVKKTVLGLTQDRLKTAEVKRSEVKRSEEKRRTTFSEPHDPGLENRREVWRAYTEAYFQRYGADPTDNAPARSAIKRFCSMVPSEEAGAIAQFFIRHNNSFYITKGHNPALLAADAAKLRTEWVTGTQITQTQAQQADKRQANKGVFEKLMSEVTGEKSKS